MLGGGVVRQHVYYALKDRPIIQAAIGNPPRLKPGEASRDPMPHAIHWPQASKYTGPISVGADPFQEELRYVVAFWCEGDSDKPIRAAVKDAWEVLTGPASEGTVVQDDGTFTVTLTPFGGLYPEAHTPPGGLMYWRLGFVLTAWVQRA